MIILALETANFSGSVALAVDGEVQAFHSFESPHGLGSALVPTIKALLEAQNLRVQDLDLVTGTTGPGSFTGVRLGLATLRGLHLAADVPLMGIDSFTWVLQSLPSSLKVEGSILVALDARRKDIFCQLFDQDRRPLKDPTSLHPEDVPAYIAGKTLVVGSGGAFLTEQMKKADFTFYKQGWMPDARDLTRVAEQNFQGPGPEAFPCTPFYLRPPDIGQGKALEKTFECVPLTRDLEDQVSLIHQTCFERGWREEEIHDLLDSPGSFGFVLKDTNKDLCMGFILARQVEDEGEILTFAVLPAHRSRGRGTFLMETLLKEFNRLKVKRVFLEVPKNQEHAINLYEKFQFAQIAEREKYYQKDSSKPADALVFERDLNKNFKV